MRLGPRRWLSCLGDGWCKQSEMKRERERGEQKTKNHNKTQTNKGKEECLIAQAEDHQRVALGTRLCWVCGARRSFWGLPNCTNIFFASIKCHHLWRDAPSLQIFRGAKKRELEENPDMLESESH